MGTLPCRCSLNQLIDKMFLFAIVELLIGEHKASNCYSLPIKVFRECHLLSNLKRHLHNVLNLNVAQAQELQHYLHESLV